jgi:hypothetical protein
VCCMVWNGAFWYIFHFLLNTDVALTWQRKSRLDSGLGCCRGDDMSTQISTWRRFRLVS